MSNTGRKRYIMQIGPGGDNFATFEEFESHQEGKEFIDDLLEERTREIFSCRMVVSLTPEEGYDELILEGIGKKRLEGKWFVRILERIGEDEDEEITVFQSAKPSERRGYMLRSMVDEQKQERKMDIMTSELDEKKKRKQQLTEEILGGKDK